MLAESTIQSNASKRLENLTRLIVSPTATPNSLKLGIIQIITMFEQELSIPEQIEFIQTLNELFSINHCQNPIPIELYFMQIITLIDSTVNTPSTFELMQLAKLSNDSMRMMAHALRGREIVIPTLLTIEELQQMQPH
jgi:hypothetical protein